MKVWSHSFATHIQIWRYQVILVRRWREAQQIGVGLYSRKTGRVRWTFFTNYRIGLIGW